MSSPDEDDTDPLLVEAVLDGVDREPTSLLAAERPEVVRQLQTVRTIVDAFDSLGIGRSLRAPGISGRTLADRVREEGPLAPAEAVRLALALCGLLVEVPGGDVRPSTVALTEAGAIQLESEAPPAVTPLATAPEVVCGAPSSSCADVYSVGVALFYALTGTYPVHERDVASLRERHRADRDRDPRRFVDALHEVRGDVSPPLARCVARALAPERRRYRDPLDLRRALESGGETGDETLVSRRWRIVAAAVALLICAAAALPWRRSPAKEAPVLTPPPRLFVAEARLGPDGMPVASDARELAPLADDGGFSVSADGQRLLWWGAAGRVTLRDLETGAEAALPGPPTRSRAVMDGAGRIVYATGEGGASAIDSVRGDGSNRERLCADCGMPLDVSRDGRFILLRYDHVGHGSVGLFDRRSGQRAEILSSGVWSLSHARLSPDGRWIALHGLSSLGRTRELVAAFRGLDPVAEGQWVSVTDGRSTTGAATWSPDGRALCYLSDVDGHRCVWSQPLAEGTMRAAGPARGLYHPHDGRRIFENVDWTHADFALAPGRVLFVAGGR